MKDKIRNFSISPLVKGSFWLALASLLGNLLNYLYSLLVGRILGPSIYGAFGSLISISMIILVLASAIQIVSAKYTSHYLVEKKEKLYTLFSTLNKKMVFIGVLIFIIFALLSPFISHFLKISSPLPIILLSLMFIVAFAAPVARGILQGMQKFLFFSAVTTLESIIKFVSAIILLALGFSLNGAVVALVLGVYISYIVIYFPLKKMLTKPKKEVIIETKKIKEDTFAVSFFYLGSILLITLNVIFVKYFFPSFEAGLFVSISTLSLIIYYLISAITTVALPQITQNFHGGGNHFKILKEATILALLIGITISALYFLFPSGIVRLFFGNEYLNAAEYLGLYSLSIIFYSLAQLFVTYFFAIQKNKPAYLPLIASIIFLLAILFFHQTLWQIIFISLIINFFLFIVLLIALYMLDYKNKLEPK